MLLAQLKDQGLDLEGQAVGLPIRTSGSIREPLELPRFGARRLLELVTVSVPPATFTEQWTAYIRTYERASSFDQW
jgi:hypothetical protein